LRVYLRCRLRFFFSTNPPVGRIVKRKKTDGLQKFRTRIVTYSSYRNTTQGNNSTIISGCRVKRGKLLPQTFFNLRPTIFSPYITHAYASYRIIYNYNTCTEKLLRRTGGTGRFLAVLFVQYLSVQSCSTMSARVVNEYSYVCVCVCECG